MKENILKDKLTLEILTNFDSLNYKDLSNIVECKKFGIEPEQCSRYLASFFPQQILYESAFSVNRKRFR